MSYKSLSSNICSHQKSSMRYLYKGTNLAHATLSCMSFSAMKSRIDVIQDAVKYVIRSVGFSKRCNPDPDSSCSCHSLISSKLPKQWFMKWLICFTPWSMLLSNNAIPPSSFGPNATFLGKFLFTPSFCKIAATDFC